MTLDDLKPVFPEVLIDLLSKNAQRSLKDAAAVNEPIKVYKWQDEAGAWHFSTDPNDADRGEVMELDGNINIIPALMPRAERDSANRLSSTIHNSPEAPLNTGVAENTFLQHCPV